MGNSPSKNSNNASPTAQAHGGLTASSSTATPASEPEPDDRKFPSFINSQSGSATQCTHSNPAISRQTASGKQQESAHLTYKNKIQSEVPIIHNKFTYFNEFDDSDRELPNEEFDLDVNIAMAKALGSSPTGYRHKAPQVCALNAIGTNSPGRPVTALVNTCANGNIDTEVSSSFSDMFTINSSSNSSLSISPPANSLPPIIEEGSKRVKKKSVSSFDIDSIIDRLLSLSTSSPVLHGKSSSPINSFMSSDFIASPKEISVICSKVREIFLNQPSLLKLQAPVKVVGDIHGQFNDLLRILKLSGLPPHSNYLFLGDYVDRGKQSLETILLLFCFKIKYPENFFMLRGNHESSNISKIYGFYDECKRRVNVKCWKLFVDVFNTLPIAAVINEKIFCVHGGLSPHLNNMKQIEDIHRPTDIPESGLLADLLWSDPDGSVHDWSESDRGVSYCFGRKIVENFNKKFNFDLIIRGHMVVEDGYEFFGKKKLVTVFSAPNYCGEFNNWGAVMSVDNGLLCSFELLKPNKKLLNHNY